MFLLINKRMTFSTTWIYLFFFLLLSFFGKSFQFSDLFWQEPCNKHGLCLRIVQELTLSAARCAKSPTCSHGDILDCFSNEAILLPFQCKHYECLEVVSFAESITACNIWFPILGHETKRKVSYAIQTIRSGLTWLDANASQPLIAAEIASKLMTKKKLK